MKKINFYIYIIFVSVAINLSVVNAEGMYKVLPRPDVYNKYYKVDNQNLKINEKYLIESFNKNTRKYKENLEGVSNVEKILVIPLEFEDVKFKDDNIKDTYTKLMESIKDYYEINSNYESQKRGMTIDYTVVDKITSNHKMEYYATSSYVTLEDNESKNISDMAKEAVEILKEKKFPLKEFDRNKDGVIDHILIIHAGKGQEETLESSLIWSHRFEIQNNGTDLGDIRALNYTTVPENAKVGTIVHELGHDFGLPDLYDIYNINQGVGMWDVMGSGSWNYLQGQEPGECPANLSAWSRELLGWADVEEVDESKTLLFRNDNGISNVYKIYLRDKYGNKDKNEYYLLEYRRRINYDEALPEEGILIWHIDEKVLDKTFFTNEINTDGEKLGVELVQADGKFHLNRSVNSNRGDSGDPFPGSTQNSIFGAFSYGLNFGNNGQYSFIEGENFNICGEIATVDIIIDSNAPIDEINTYAPLNESNVSREITFSFDLIHNCSEYKLQISKDNEFENPIQISINSDDLVEVIDNKLLFKYDFSYMLEDNTKYYWRISATNPATNSRNVVWSEVKTMYYTKDTNIDAPGNFVWDITDNRINLNWVNEDDATGYIVMCNGEEKYVASSIFNIDNDNKEYVIKVRSINERTSSNFEDEIVIDTTKVPYIEAEVLEEDVILPKKIILNIKDGTFKKGGNYNRATVKTDEKTTPKGITNGKVLWINDSKIEIELEREDTVILEKDIELTIIVSKYLVNGLHNRDLEAKAILKSNNKNYNNDVKFRFSGDNKNRLMQIKKGMEYSINGGLSYEVCEDNDIELKASQLKILENQNEIIVRDNNSYQVICLLDNNKTPSVIVNFVDKKIEGLTKDMEFSFDGINWSDDTSRLDSMKNNFFVRYKGNGRIKPSNIQEYLDV